MSDATKKQREKGLEVAAAAAAAANAGARDDADADDAQWASLAARLARVGAGAAGTSAVPPLPDFIAEPLFSCVHAFLDTYERMNRNHWEFAAWDAHALMSRNPCDNPACPEKACGKVVLTKPCSAGRVYCSERCFAAVNGQQRKSKSAEKQADNDRDDEQERPTMRAATAIRQGPSLPDSNTSVNGINQSFLDTHKRINQAYLEFAAWIAVPEMSRNPCDNPACPEKACGNVVLTKPCSAGRFYCSKRCFLAVWRRDNLVEYNCDAVRRARFATENNGQQRKSKRKRDHDDEHERPKKRAKIVV